jgi:uncharacterized protein YqjF (DUF2071 family)
MKTNVCKNQTKTFRIDGTTEAGGDFSGWALHAMRDLDGGPALLEDWARILFIHYAVDPAALQPQIPFRLDVREGLAYVSLTAFYGHGLRPVSLGPAGQWVSRPAQFPFILNVRTYIRHGVEDGIHFLAEWIPNRLAATIGRRWFGLPFHTGSLTYEHDADRARGRVEDDRRGGVFDYEATWPRDAVFTVAEPGSLTEWLLERYTAFTQLTHQARFFRVWHPAWPQTAANVRVLEDGLLRSTGPWFEHARLIGANYSPGFYDVQMGRAHRLVAEAPAVFPAVPAIAFS